MLVRDAKAEDASAIADLLARVISTLEIYSVEARRSEIAKYGADALGEIIQDGVVVLAEEEGKIVGVCLGYDDDGLLWLSWFVVDGQSRRKGATRQMLARFTERARERTHKVWCDCRTTNVASISLLEEAGFERIATVQHHWYGQDFILWQKHLETAQA